MRILFTGKCHLKLISKQIKSCFHSTLCDGSEFCAQQLSEAYFAYKFCVNKPDS